MKAQFAVPVLVLCALLHWAVASASGCERVAFSSQAFVVPQQAVVVSAVPQFAVQAFAVPRATAVVASSNCFVPSVVSVQAFGGVSAVASAGGVSAVTSGARGLGGRGRSRAVSSSGGFFGFGILGPNRSRAVSVR